MLDTTKRISVYQPQQPGLIFPEIPEFKTPAEERQHRKERLVAACRAFALQGYDYGFAGHLTVRDPEHPDLYWTNPMDVHFSQVKVSNLILVDHEGQVREGQYAVNRAGFVLHAAVHEAHPEIVAMCHAHTVYGTAFAALGKKLEPVTQDAAAFYEDHVVIGDEAGQVAVEVKGAIAWPTPSPEPWPADRQSSQHRFGGVLVHRPGALLPAAADDRRDRDHAEARLARTRALQPRTCRQRLHRLAAFSADLRAPGSDPA